MDEQEEIDREIFRIRPELKEVLKPLRIYGQGDFVDESVEAVISLFVQGWLHLYGVDEAFGGHKPFYTPKEGLHIEPESRYQPDD
jgi:hypothetical protein